MKSLEILITNDLEILQSAMGENLYPGVFAQGKRPRGASLGRTYATGDPSDYRGLCVKRPSDKSLPRELMLDKAFL